MNRILLVVLSAFALANAGCAIAGTNAVINPFDWSDQPIAKAPISIPPGQPAVAMATR